jgi:hypothetical protein
MSESLKLGAYGWHHKHWQQSFYDDELPADWRLTFYANEFNTVLVPAHYMGTDRDIEQWCEDVNEAFRFYIEWPQQVDSATALREELASMGALLGGVLLPANTQLQSAALPPDCPVYHWQANSLWRGIWRPDHPLRTDLAVFDAEQRDLRQQRQCLEAFVADSEGRCRALLLSDPELEIKKLQELKTLLEIMGL